MLDPIVKVYMKVLEWIQIQIHTYYQLFQWYEFLNKNPYSSMQESNPSIIVVLSNRMESL